MRDLDLNDPLVLEQSLVVSASAGSGKTFTLTVLVTASLGREQLRPYEILATTFGEASASDLRERLLRPLDLLAALDAGAWTGLLPRLGQPGGAEVDAALQALPLAESLRRSAREVAQASALWAGVSWAQAPDRARAFWQRIRREAELLQVSTIHALALGLLRQGEGAPEAILDPAHPALLRLLRQTGRAALSLPEGHPDQVPARVLLAWAERNWPALSAAHDGHRDAMGHLEPEDPLALRAAFHAALAGAEAAFAPMVRDPQLALDPASKSRRFFKPSCILAMAPAGGLLARVRWAEQQSRVVRDLDAIPGYYSAAFQAALAALEPVAGAWEAWLRCLLVGLLRAFEQAKAEQGQATFGDLVRAALQGLRQGRLEPPSPRLLLVDECQDTSRAQDAFLAALGAGRTVRVGDLKQAIYGFRGGDPELLRDHLQAAGELAFRLPCNFRSAAPVVALANRYVEEVWPQLDPDAGNLDGRQQAVGASTLPVGLVRAEGPARGSDLPALAPWIAALSTEAGWRQTLGAAGGAGGRRRALLLRQRTKLSGLLQRLKSRGVQPYVVAKEGFWESPGVRLVLAALEAAAHPERPLPAAALLRNLAGLSDAQLTALAAAQEGRPRLQGLAALDPDQVPAAHREAVRWLQGLGRASTQDLAGQLLVQGALLRLLSAQRAHGAMEPMRARRNLAALLAMLLELPASPVAAYALLEEAKAMVRGDLPACVDGVDLIIQTVHGSKGLEYDDVILPLLNAPPRSFRHGELRTDPGTGALALAWKLGNHPGPAYAALKPIVEARQRRDDLNLLYVACTRARERMCLLLQDPGKAKGPAESRTWAQWGQVLAGAHPELLTLDNLPTAEAVPPVAVAPVQAPEPRRALIPPEPAPAETEVPGAGLQARQDGEAMHAFLRDLLVRWEDPAFEACLAQPPPVRQARENALRFLGQFEVRGWRRLRRRTELPIAGAAASGAEGRADLVVWAPDRIHLLDFKHAKGFGPEELAGYRAQLQRYGDALRAREGLPVEAWLVALRSGEWVRVF
jgi:ATP-dependent exoDNAse (exonuclease V) beta subunit